MSGFLSRAGQNQQQDFLETVNYEVVLTNENVVKAVKELQKEKILAVDTENTGLVAFEDKPLLLQIGSPSKCYIFPAYEGLDLSPIKPLLENFGILLLLQNAKYDWKFIKYHYDIEMNNMYDTQAAERLLTVGRLGTAMPSLRFLVKKYLGIEMIKEIRNGFINRDPVASPITEREYRYSAGDVLCLHEIYYQQLARLKEQGLLEVAKLEFDVTPPTAEMELAGVLIDIKSWRKNLEKAKKNCDRLSAEIFSYFEEVVAQKNLFNLPLFNLGSPAQLQSNLRRLGFNLESTDEAELKKHINKHSVFKLLIEYRGQEKLINTYGEKLLQKISPVTGRLHANFNQLRAETGRASSSAPNMQNIPGFNPKDPYSLDFRSCIIARPGHKLVTADYSQQEIRALADLSGDPTFFKAYTEVDENGNFLDAHTYTAATIFNVPYDKVTKAQRNESKAVNFFLIYGGGPPALAEKLKISIEEAKAIINNYFKHYQAIRSFLNKEAKKALNNLSTTTVSGRKRYYTLPPETDPSFSRAVAAIERQGKNCVDSETEALTIGRGWVKGFDLREDDTILTKNPTTGELEWQKMMTLKLFPEEEGEYFRIKSKSFEVITTPEHRWLVYNEATGKDCCRTTEQLSEWGDHHIHRTGNYLGSKEEFFNDDLIEVCGWFLTDGSHELRQRKTMPPRHIIKIGQSLRANPEKVSRIKNVLGRIDPGCWEGKPNKRTKLVSWSLSEDLSLKIHNLFPKRILTIDFLLKLTSAQLKLLFDVMMLGDGHCSSALEVFTAGTEERSAIFQVLCSMVGFASNAYCRDMRGYAPKSDKLLNIPKQKDCWYVHIHRRGKVQVNQGQKEKFVGRVAVWCPVVPNTYFVARRKGQVFITGNTKIQGSSADVTKKGLVILYNKLKELGFDAKLLMVVHDEIVVEVIESQAKAVAKLVEESMIAGWEFYFKKIPMVVEANISDSWEK